MKYSLNECIARPKYEAGRVYPLTEHLLSVAWAMGDPGGDESEKLRFLAGLLHDAGKAHNAWQDYIRLPADKRRKGVPHAFAGAMLFALTLDELLSVWSIQRQEKGQLLHLGIQLIYSIYNHHGRIDDTCGDMPPWQADFSPKELLSCDLNGLCDLARGYCGQLESLCGNMNEDYLKKRFRNISASWVKWQNGALGSVCRKQRSGNLYVQSARLCLANTMENHRLIAGDRLHAAGLDAVSVKEGVGAEKVPLQCLQRLDDVTTGKGIIAPSRAAAILEKLAEFCVRRREQLAGSGAQVSLLEKREDCRRTALINFKRARDARIFTLELPTGYGKTLSSLSVALEAIAGGSCRRIIYVAPYISILSQAAAEIVKATGLEVALHHHLSALMNALSEVEQDDEGNIAIEAWLAPVVATTYNQFFRALFPVRAQHTLRLLGLKDAFVIIDEPQGVAATSWNPFLTFLEAAAAELGCRILFTTATLPELAGGILESASVSLGREEPLFNRYLVKLIGELDEESLAGEVENAFREGHTVAVILNTISDAAMVYNHVKKGLESETDAKLFFLSGRLTSLHKRRRIAEIKSALESKKRVVVVCTQVLEAGVDLSFRIVFRALPVIPSVVQAAGRCNRHGENETGTVLLFKFRRGGTMETRGFVYRDKDQREVTDQCLVEYPGFEESASTTVVAEYYRKCFQRNTNQAFLQKIEEAANGHWSALAGIEPFGAEVFEYGVFVPLYFGDLPDFVAQAFEHFRVSGPEALWNLYTSRGFLSSLGFNERKRFMALMYQFIVQVSEKAAAEIGERVGDRMLLRLRYPSLYKEDTGLSLLSADKPFDEQFI
ncbi:MAG: CRISPR-associated helicase Cas3' [Bacillota bacterium]